MDVPSPATERRVENGKDERSSNEVSDTEETSENDTARVEEEAKEFRSPTRIIQERIQNITKQLKELSEGSHAEYEMRRKELEHNYEETKRTVEGWLESASEQVEEEHKAERKRAIEEFELKKVDLKESAINDLIEKRKNIDVERQNMELAGDVMEIKPIVTRKRELRRRMNESAPIPESSKRRKTTGNGLICPLEDDEVMADLLAIYKGKMPVSVRTAAVTSTQPTVSSPRALEVPPDVRLEDGKLSYDKKVFIRGQAVFLDSSDGTRISGTIQSIGQSEVLVRRTSGDQKIKVHISALLKGKYAVRKRS